MKRILLAILVSVSATASDAPPFALTTVRDTCPEYGTVVTRHVLMMGEQWKFTFTAPPSWKARMETNDKRVTFIRPDGRAGVSVQLLPATEKTSVEDKREAILASHAGGKITSENECFANGVNGRIYELEQGANGNRLTVRLAQIPYGGGIVQIKASVPAGAPEARHEFFSLLNSLKIEAAKADATAGGKTNTGRGSI